MPERLRELEILLEKHTKDLNDLLDKKAEAKNAAGIAVSLVDKYDTEIKKVENFKKLIEQNIMIEKKLIDAAR